MRTYYARSEKEHYTFRAKNISDARIWIENHLDCSQQWTFGEVMNPTDIIMLTSEQYNINP